VMLSRNLPHIISNRDAKKMKGQIALHSRMRLIPLMSIREAYTWGPSASPHSPLSFLPL
jgi:hypothetical protein